MTTNPESKTPFDNEFLKCWLRENSSGIYRPAKEAADLIVHLENKLNEALVEVEKLRNDQNGVVAEASRQVTESDSLYRKTCQQRDEALAQLADALEHQEVPFHTCSGKGCKNKYCQMRQQLAEAAKQVQSLIIYCDSDICHNQQDIINIKHDLVKLHSVMKPQQSKQGE